MKKIGLFTVILLVGTISAFGQRSSIDNARSSALQVEYLCSAHLDGNSYLLFSIANKWYLLVVKNKNRYEEYYLTNDSLGVDIHKRRIIRGNRKLLNKAFAKEAHYC